jgi:hypothetical protein
MSTHWFHDHMFSYRRGSKGNAGMFNIYSGLDRGAEDIVDGVNLRLPSGRADLTGKTWANLDYDVNLMLADKAWDRDGQLAFDIFDFDGFLGDVMTVNLGYKPFFEVEPRKYRFRILNASVSRFFAVALSDGSPIVQIGNDGNLLPHPVSLTALATQGIAERFDIVIDFSRYKCGDKVWFVNLVRAQTAGEQAGTMSIAEGAFSGQLDDPCGAGSSVPRRRARADPSGRPGADTMIPNPDLSAIPVARERVFEGSGAAASRRCSTRDAFGGRGSIDRRRRHAERRLRRISGRAADRHARDLDAEEQAAAAGIIPSTFISGRDRSGAQRQRRERAAMGARTQGCLPPLTREQRDHHDAVPRLRGHLHGALPQHGAQTTRCCSGGTSTLRARPCSRRCRRPFPRRRGSPSSIPTKVLPRAGEGSRDPGGSVRLRRRVLRILRERGGARSAPWNAGYFSQRGADDPGGRTRAVPRSDQGRTVAIELMCRRAAMPVARDRASRAGQRRSGRADGEGRLLSLDQHRPGHDTPAVLKAFAAQFHAGPGWIFLTGKRADIDLLSKKNRPVPGPIPRTRTVTCRRC